MHCGVAVKRALIALALGLGLGACHGGLPAADGGPAAGDAPAAISDAAASPDAAGGDDHARLAILDLMKRVADWQIHQLAGNSAATWQEAVFYTGLVATFTSTGELRFLEALLDWGNQNAWTPRVDRMHPDNQCAGQTYVEVHLLDGVAAHLAGTRQVMDQAIATGQRGRDVWWWSDALFMAPAVLARLGTATGDAKYDDALNTRWWDVYDALYDPASDLFFRDASYLTARCPDGEKMFWSRGNAWVVAGIARVLQSLPASYPDRGRYVDLLRRMSARLATLQRADGFWSSCLTDPTAFPEPETSGTAGFVYGIAWGVNHGLLDRATYLPVIRKGWHALVGAVDASGKLRWVQNVGSAPGKTVEDDSHPYGVGLFLLAASEVVPLADDVE
jgi:unsaturated rhamnogalacturonyl hydrolase